MEKDISLNFEYGKCLVFKRVGLSWPYLDYIDLLKTKSSVLILRKIIKF